MEMNIELKNKIDPVVYNEFRDMVGWGTLLPEQVEAVLSNSICFSLECEGETIAITRVLWDGGYTAYIADVIVHEKHRGHGIGKKILRYRFPVLANDTDADGRKVSECRGGDKQTVCR